MSTMMLDVVLVTTRVTDRTANVEHAGAIRVSRHAHTDTVLCDVLYAVTLVSEATKAMDCPSPNDMPNTGTVLGGSPSVPWMTPVRSSASPSL